MVWMGKITKEPVPVFELIQDDAREMESGSLDNVDQPSFEASVQLPVSEPPEDASSLDDVLPVETDRIIVRMGTEDLLLQSLELPGEAPVGISGFKPETEKPKIPVVVVVGEMESVISGLVHVETEMSLQGQPPSGIFPAAARRMALEADIVKSLRDSAGPWTGLIYSWASWKLQG
jgi:hypothetical protein